MLVASEVHARLRAKAAAGTVPAACSSGNPPPVAASATPPSALSAERVAALAPQTDARRRDLDVAKLDAGRLVLTQATAELGWGPGLELLITVSGQRLTAAPLSHFAASPVAALLGGDLAARAADLQADVDARLDEQRAEILRLDSKGRLLLTSPLRARLAVTRDARVVVLTDLVRHSVEVVPIAVAAALLT